MNIRAELKSLKANYEQSLQLYERTKKTQYYLIYQSSFRDYLSFIERHQLRTGDVDKLIFTDLLTVFEEKELSARKKKKSNRPSSKDMILSLLRQEGRPMTARAISARCSLTVSPTNKYLTILEKENKIHHVVSSKGIGNAYLWSVV